MNWNYIYPASKAKLSSLIMCVHVPGHSSSLPRKKKKKKIIKNVIAWKVFWNKIIECQTRNFVVCWYITKHFQIAAKCHAVSGSGDAIFNKVPDHISPTLKDFASHFSADSFVILTQCNVAFAKRLLLMDRAAV